ncbi:cellulose biosynthesis protein BcsN [Rhizobium grahamii]|uniref:cellulose biosynthesis protein BcsN n=1 Tax=Rhizobium grahamii TaxID=1120045 RepID=UPI00167A30F7|nr:cellulose biosynthesis protein BcsN [Rhizobium grahamii]
MRRPKTFSLLKALGLALLAGLVAGCQSSGNVSSPNSSETVPAERALALPPPGGPSIVSVVEHKRGNGTEQMISLYTSSSVSGQNFLKVQFLGASGANPGIGSASYQMISENGIIREAFAAVPGVQMARSTTYLQNSYGPFSYASGESGSGDTCIYGWQQIRSSRSAHTQARNFGMIQVRLRLCDARATERQLLGIMYGYTIVGTLNGEIWNPFGFPHGADPTLGRPGNPIYPDEGGYRNTPMAFGYEPARPEIQSRVVRVRSVQPKAEEAPLQLPPPTGPRVPLPDGASGQPQPDMSAAPSNEQTQQKTVTASGVTVPLPECIGDSAMTAACQR